MNGIQNTYKLTIFVRIIRNMDKKLTLKLDSSVIEQAKVYAQNHKISLSKMIESYLKNITKKSKKLDKENKDMTPLVASLSGVIEWSADDNYKETYKDYLAQKYQ